jgi:hypothetical protein
MKENFKNQKFPTVFSDCVNNCLKVQYSWARLLALIMFEQELDVQCRTRFHQKIGPLHIHCVSYKTFPTFATSRPGASNFCTVQFRVRHKQSCAMKADIEITIDCKSGSSGRRSICSHILQFYPLSCPTEWEFTKKIVKYMYRAPSAGHAVYINII